MILERAIRPVLIQSHVSICHAVLRLYHHPLSGFDKLIVIRIVRASLQLVNALAKRAEQRLRGAWVERDPLIPAVTTFKGVPEVLGKLLNSTRVL